MQTNRLVKRRMREYCKQHHIAAHLMTDTDVWGNGARTTAWRVSGHAKIEQSAQKTGALCNLLFPLNEHQLFRRRLESAYDALHGTKEGSAKQRDIAQFCGISAREPWCAETFWYAAKHEAGYNGPRPDNIAYVPAWEYFSRAHNLIVPRSLWLPGMGVTFVWDYAKYVGSGDHIGVLSNDGPNGVSVKFGTRVPTDEGNASGFGGDAVREEVRPLSCINLVFDLARLQH